MFRFSKYGVLVSQTSTAGYSSSTLRQAAWPIPPAVRLRIYEEYLQFAMAAVHLDNQASDLFPIEPDAVGLASVNAPLYGLAGDDFPLLFEVVVPASELLKRAVFERFLVVADELLPVLNCQWP